MEKLFIILSILSCGAKTWAQSGPSNYISGGILNGAYPLETIPTKRMIPYEYVREADVIWSKRIWQTIDLREKINQPIYFPFDEYDASGNWQKNSSRWSLWTILKTHVLNGDLTVFSPYNPLQFDLTDGDQLKYPIDHTPGSDFDSDSTYRNELFSYLATLGPQSPTPCVTFDGQDSTRILDNGTIEYIYPPRDTIWLLSQDIIQYKIKEDWFFDKERSVMDVRILAIAPVTYNRDDQGQITGLKELFWLYFPHCRFVLNNYYVFNEHNDTQWMSFDDLFWKRRFTSVIYKESNVYDRKIEDYKTGVNALFEAEKVKEEIRTIEHDIWNF